MTLADDLAFALHLAELADDISMSHFRREPATRTKQDGTIVTEADEAVERAIRQELSSAHPADAILGEEEGDTGSARRRWIVDPIDGTNNYASGIPIWATLIALEEDGEIVVGVCSAPALGERYHAAKGMGAHRGTDRLRVSQIDRLTEARVAYPTLSSFAEHGRERGFMSLAGRARWSRGFGDFWGHMLVASGSVDVMVEPVVNVWDLAPLILIVEEAGGRFTDLDGTRGIEGGSALSSNRLLHEQVLDLFVPAPS